MPVLISITVTNLIIKSFCALKIDFDNNFIQYSQNLKL